MIQGEVLETSSSYMSLILRLFPSWPGEISWLSSKVKSFCRDGNLTFCLHGQPFLYNAMEQTETILMK